MKSQIERKKKISEESEFYWKKRRKTIAKLKHPLYNFYAKKISKRMR